MRGRRESRRRRFLIVGEYYCTASGDDKSSSPRAPSWTFADFRSPSSVAEKRIGAKPRAPIVLFPRRDRLLLRQSSDEAANARLSINAYRCTLPIDVRDMFPRARISCIFFSRQYFFHRAGILSPRATSSALFMHK